MFPLMSLPLRLDDIHRAEQMVVHICKNQFTCVYMFAYSINAEDPYTPRNITQY